ncbi:MAG: hypothetical protein J3K34DRAFT_516728 [Monoraphidium minutum]|nr:MAG: hypothetical protein J3K34DRAFT_516728 [Monoraphidium minutum]
MSAPEEQQEGPDEEGTAALDPEALREQLEAAPRHGVNARFLLLERARAIAQGEAAQGIKPGKAPLARAGAPPPPPRAAGPPPPTGPQLLALVPTPARPWVPYAARGAAPQAARQQAALALAASYLSLLARELRLQPGERAREAVAGDPQLQAAASKAALAHEATLHLAVSTPAQYRAAAGRLGLDAAEARHVPAAAMVELRARYLGAANGAAAGAAGEGGAGGGTDDGGGGEGGARGAKRRRVDGAGGSGSGGGGGSEGGGGDEGGGAAGADTMEDIFGVGSEEEALEEGDEEAAAPEDGAAPEQGAAPEAAGGGGGGSGNSGGDRDGQQQQQQQQEQLPADVQEQVLAFVQGVLEPLRAANLVDPSLAAVVASKAAAKIAARHAGAGDAGFLVREYGAVTKLVTSLVDHYRKHPPR